MDDPMQSHSSHRHEPLHPLFSQKTISRPVAVSGVGIHTGESIHLELHPAPEGSGIVFRRVDSGGGEIPALSRPGASAELAPRPARPDLARSPLEHPLSPPAESD